MTRQCLYCNKEITKDSSSNFCSKECWTEYKKLKAFNVGADKQATVLLKRPDIQQMTHGNSQATEGEATPAMAKQELDFDKKLEALERTLNDKIIEIKDTLRAHIDNPPSVNSPVDDATVQTLIKTVASIEQKVTELEGNMRNLAKSEKRMVGLEKKLKLVGSDEIAQKKGFFARLFS